jgi:hypothetical protein
MGGVCQKAALGAPGRMRLERTSDRLKRPFKDRVSKRLNWQVILASNCSIAGRRIQADSAKEEISLGLLGR